jgi:hypothetical protein
MNESNSGDRVSKESLTDTDAQILSLAIRVDELQRKVSALHSLLQDTIESMDPVKPLSVWYYDARFPLDVANMYKAEYWDTNVKRWVGPEPTFSVVVALDSKHSYEVEIRVYDFITKEARSSFLVRVDGLAVPWKIIEDKTYRALLIPPRSGLISLQFACNESKSPRDLNPKSTDIRKMSFSVGYIRVRTVETSRGGHKRDAAIL